MLQVAENLLQLIIKIACMRFLSNALDIKHNESDLTSLNLQLFSASQYFCKINAQWQFLFSYAVLSS